MKEIKAEIHRLSVDLARSRVHEVEGMRQLVKLLYEEAREKLVAAEGDDVLRLQGEARSLRKLDDRLNNLPVTATSEEQKQ